MHSSVQRKDSGNKKGKSYKDLPFVMPCHCRFLCFIGKTNVFLLYYCCTCFYFFTPYI